jgi:hypothetical protein
MECDLCDCVRFQYSFFSGPKNFYGISKDFSNHAEAAYNEFHSFLIFYMFSHPVHLLSKRQPKSTASVLSAQNAASKFLYARVMTHELTSSIINSYLMQV